MLEFKPIISLPHPNEEDWLSSGIGCSYIGLGFKTGGGNVRIECKGYDSYEKFTWQDELHDMILRKIFAL